MEQLERAGNALEEALFRPFGAFVRRPRDTTDFRPRRKTIVQIIFVPVDFPGIAPGPVNADATFTGRVLAWDVRLVVRAGQCARWHIHLLSGSIGQRREISQRLEPREEEVGTAPDGGERWQSDDLLSHWTFWDLELQRAVLGADDRIALVAEFVEIAVVDPHILSELVLANQAGAEHERRDAPLHAVVGSTLRQVRAVRRAAANHPAAVHVHRRVARIHATDVRAKWHGVAVRILMFVVEVVVPLRIRAQCRIIFVWREHKWRTAAP